MKKKFKKLLSVMLCITTIGAMALFTGCGSNNKDTNSSNATGTEAVKDTEASTDASTGNANADTYGTEKKAVIGVLVSDASTAEALGFRSYYEEYLQKQYNVQFNYSDELKNAEDETSAIENFIAQGCQAIISFSSFDRAAQIELCESAKIYYSVATGVLTNEEFDKYKGYEYYVGSIGPDLHTEYQTGYDMASKYISAGDTNFLIFGGAVCYGTEMHVYRVAGMLAAMCAADSTGKTTYDGETTEEGIVSKITGNVDPSLLTGDMFKIDYIQGYDMDDAWFGSIAEKMGTPGLQAVLAVGNGADFFGTAAQGTDIKIATIDSYSEALGTAMQAGQVDYLAGKFAPSVGPIFIATLDAINGCPIRDAEGNAFTISQGYWVATDYTSFSEYYEAGSSTTDPVYAKNILDKYLITANNGTTYDDFKTFVEAYTFDEISALK